MVTHDRSVDLVSVGDRASRGITRRRAATLDMAGGAPS